MGNYAHLLENNKNGDKGKHVNNGSRVQRDTISKVRVVQCYMYINIELLLLFVSILQMSNTENCPFICQ